MKDYGHKPEMRPLTPAEVVACRSCDINTEDAAMEALAINGCWFGCETPVVPTDDPLWVVKYGGGQI